MAQGARPQMGPGRSGGGVSSGTSGAPESPTATPPAGTMAASGGCGCGTGTAGPSIELPPGGGTGDAAPSVRPTGEGVGADIGAWNNNKRITGLWSINQNRNSWIYIDGVGWKKLANNSDSAIVALSLLGAHAREKNSTVNYRDEADGMIHEIYVW